MAYSNNVMIVRHKLLSKLVELWKDDRLESDIDRLPLILSPRRGKEVVGRCCIHKERAVWKYKTLPLLGFDMQDETDELTPLSEYARKAMARTKEEKENLLCVIDEACTSCVQINYEVSNLCRGCLSRACLSACPKGCISFKRNGQARINHDECISCGRCHDACPYHSIVYIPVPCEVSCPVGAIHKGEYGIEKIDESKCIYCGACMNACPFGAIFEISQVFDVLQAIRRGEEVVAIVAPAILGQYDAERDEVYGAIKAVGFSDVIEVAQGAMDTVRHEGHELIEKLDRGQAFMTTSCCPAFYEVVNKHAPDLKKYISGSGSPMLYTAQRARAKHPDAKIVFIGPCVAKRKEKRRPEVDVDLVMTFEELASVFKGLEIDLKEQKPFAPEFESVREAHGFAQNGGVMNAVKEYLKSLPETRDRVDRITGEAISALDKKQISKLKVYGKTGKCPVQFIEVMSCPGGCVNGPSAHNDLMGARKQLKKELDLITKTYAQEGEAGGE